MTKKIGRVLTYGDRKPRIESHDLLITQSCEVTLKNLCRNISSSARLMVTKLDRVVIECDGTPYIKPHDHGIS